MKSLYVFLLAVPAFAAGPADTLAGLAARGDWAGIAAYTKVHPSAAVSVEGRYLQSHAALAANDDNRAACGFAGAPAPEEWRKWTEALLTANPGSAPTHYLAGDAFARTGDLARAAHEFDNALAIDPRNALALHARGVLRTLLGEQDSALLDFVAASGANHALAAAHVSRGYLYVSRKASAVSELKAFDAALLLDARSYLALLGRAQALAAVARGVDAIASIDASTAPCPALASLGGDDRRDLFTWIKEFSPLRLAAARDDAGTTLRTLLTQFGENRDAASAKKVVDFIASTDDQKARSMGTLTLQSMEKTQPDLAPLIGKAVNEKKIENETLRGQLVKEGSVKTSAESELGLRFKKDGIDIGGSVKAATSGDLKAYSDLKLKELDKQSAATDQLGAQLNSPKAQAGGAESAAIGTALVEDGSAPRIFHNVLFYPAPARRSSK